jgi:hypothetical protein
VREYSFFQNCFRKLAKICNKNLSWAGDRSHGGIMSLKFSFFKLKFKFNKILEFCHLLLGYCSLIL